MTRRAIILLLIFVSAISRGQDVTAIFKQAEALEKAFKDDEALARYLEILKYEPKNVDALCKVSQLYNIIGKRLSDKSKEKEYYNKGLEYAKTAFKLNPNNSEVNFVMAVSMGRVAQVSSGEEKVKAVKEIKNYADRSIQLDPKNFKGYHVLAKWHYEVSDLSGIERWLVKVAYGALPVASVDQAIVNYEKSKQLAPGFLLNYLELAKAYKRKNDTKKARLLLEQLQKLPVRSSDDPKIKSLGRKMLDEL